MENASKALIIAGAILLSILLISLGIMIFTKAQETVNNTGMSETEMQVFNSKFIKYEGTKKSGSLVKALVNEVISNNADSSTPTVSMKLDGATLKTTSKIDTKETYTVALTYNTSGNNKGYVKSVTITTE